MVGMTESGSITGLCGEALLLQKGVHDMKAISSEEYLLLPSLANLVLQCCKISAYSIELAHKWFGSPHTCSELESNP